MVSELAEGRRLKPRMEVPKEGNRGGDCPSCGTSRTSAGREGLGDSLVPSPLFSTYFFNFLRRVVIGVAQGSSDADR